MRKRGRERERKTTIREDLSDLVVMARSSIQIGDRLYTVITAMKKPEGVQIAQPLRFYPRYPIGKGLCSHGDEVKASSSSRGASSTTTDWLLRKLVQIDRVAVEKSVGATFSPPALFFPFNKVETGEHLQTGSERYGMGLTARQSILLIDIRCCLDSGHLRT